MTDHPFFQVVINRAIELLSTGAGADRDTYLLIERMLKEVGGQSLMEDVEYDARNRTFWLKDHTDIDIERHRLR